MTRAREVAKYFTKADQQSTDTLLLGDSDIVRVIIPGVGLDTNDANDNDLLYWNASTGQLNFKQNTRQAVDVYTTMDSLPFNHDEGKMVYVDSDDRLYLWQGQGYYTITLTNADVSAIGGLNASYELAKDGTSTVLTLTASDSDGTPIIWDYSVTSGDLTTNTVTDSGNGRFTITPGTTDSAEGTFNITFSASDGINTSIATASFSLTFESYYILSIPPTSYTTNETRGTISHRTEKPVSVDSSGNIYTGFYAGNYIGQQTQGTNQQVTHVVTKHNSAGEFTSARAYYCNDNNYNGDYADSIGMHLADDGYLYEVRVSTWTQEGQNRKAFFLVRMNTSDLSINKMNTIHNGNSFWWLRAGMQWFMSSDDKAILFGPNQGSNSNRPWVMTFDIVDTAQMNSLSSVSTNWTFYTGISAAYNICDNEPFLAHEMPDGNFFIAGHGYDLQDTTAYHRHGGYIAAVMPSNLSGNLKAMASSVRTSSALSKYDRISSRTAASIGTSSAWSTYVPFYHVSSSTSQNYGGLLKFYSTSTTHFVDAGASSSDYQPWVKLADGSNQITPRGIATDGTYLYVIGEGDGAGNNDYQYIIKLDENRNVVKCLRDTNNNPYLRGVWYYKDTLWFALSGTFASDSLSTGAWMKLDTDLNTDINGITNTGLGFSTITTVTATDPNDVRTRSFQSPSLTANSSSFLENAYGSFPTNYGANVNYYDGTPTTTVPDRDAIEL